MTSLAHVVPESFFNCSKLGQSVDRELPRETMLNTLLCSCSKRLSFFCQSLIRWSGPRQLSVLDPVSVKSASPMVSSHTADHAPLTTTKQLC